MSRLTASAGMSNPRDPIGHQEIAPGMPPPVSHRFGPQHHNICWNEFATTLHDVHLLHEKLTPVIDSADHFSFVKGATCERLKVLNLGRGGTTFTDAPLNLCS